MEKFHVHEETIELEKIYLGRFPIMLQSKLCVLNNASFEMRKQMGECPFDQGGYFVIDGLAIGLGLQYASSSTVVEYADEDIFGDDYESSENELIISPLVRYYFGESGIWTSFDYAIATISMDDSDGSFDDEEFPKRSAINLKLGYAIS